MKEVTQKQRVINRLNEVGYVDNFWAIQNYILRLGAIIHDLTKEGWAFNLRKFGDNEHRKNFYYYLKNQPLTNNVKSFLEQWPSKEKVTNTLF